MATTQITIPSIGGSEPGETVYGWRVSVELGDMASAAEPTEIEVQTSREFPDKTLVIISFGLPGNRSSIQRLIDGYWRGGRLLSGGTLELFD